MNDEIFLSIKPKFVNLIFSKEKNHEFRKRKPKCKINKMWIYTSSPISELQFLAEVDEPIVYPDKISINGYGNSDFNKGLKKSKFAFPIKRLFKLDKPLPLNILKEDYNFTPPQNFVYCKKYEKLKNHLKVKNLIEIY